jgi:hypothetical protein
LKQELTEAERLGVADGEGAAWAFERIAAGRCEGDGEEYTLRRALEECCRRDTLAMVEIHSTLALASTAVEEEIRVEAKNEEPNEATNRSVI